MMVCTPGPNMLYLVSRSIAQGRAAGFVSLLGVATGFVIYLAAAALSRTLPCVSSSPCTSPR